MGVDMPLCSRRAWTTFQGPVDPSRLPTCPPQVATTTASSFHAFNPDTQAGRRRVFIMTTIQTQRPTLLYVSQFYPDKTRTTVPVLSRHSHTENTGVPEASRDATQAPDSIRILTWWPEAASAEQV